MKLINHESVKIGLFLDVHSLSFWIKNNRIFFENEDFSDLNILTSLLHISVKAEDIYFKFRRIYPKSSK
jgi:hypothetical protein